MRRFLVLMLALILAACGTAAVPNEPEASPVGSPAVEPSPASPAPDEGAQGSDGAQNELVEQVKQQLASMIDQPASALTLESMESTEWNSGALGCPEQGMMYTQVIEPGHELIFTDGTQTYEVHTADRTDTAIWCENGQPRPLN